MHNDQNVGLRVAFKDLLPHVEQFAKDHPLYAKQNTSHAEQAVAMGIFYGCPAWHEESLCVVENNDPFSYTKLHCAQHLPGFLYIERDEDDRLSFANNGLAALDPKEITFCYVTAEEVLEDLSFIVANPGLNKYLGK